MEGHGENKDDVSVSCSFTFKGEANVFKVEKFLNNVLKTKAQDMLRCKGLLAAKGMDTKFSFQGVHNMLSAGLHSEWKADEERICQFVFTGRSAENDLETRPHKVTENRFKVGDLVEANRGAGCWSPGRIIKVWDEGNPYRVQLESGQQVWAPDDTDDFIRARRARGNQEDQCQPS
eukprot:Skav202904  [mRNA]  locus=scaffold3908:97788:99648:- [translate_table: standard]